MTPENSPTPTEPAYQPPPRPRGGCVGTVTKLLFFSVLLVALLLPFTPFAGKIKRSLQQLIDSAKATKERIITRDDGF